MKYDSSLTERNKVNVFAHEDEDLWGWREAFIYFCVGIAASLARRTGRRKSIKVKINLVIIWQVLEQ